VITALGTLPLSSSKAWHVSSPTSGRPSSRLYEAAQLETTLGRLTAMNDQMDLEILVVMDVPYPGRKASRGGEQPCLAQNAPNSP
jgi:hypothetical protein